MRLNLHETAHAVGEQAQYLADAVRNGKVEGHIPPDGDFHAKDAWVETDSVKSNLETRLKIGNIAQDQYKDMLHSLEDLEKRYESTE